MWNLNYDTNELINKTETNSQTENKHGYQGKRGEGINWAIGIDIYTLLHIKLEKEMATHFSILAWRIPWTEESGGLRSMGLQRVGHD